MQIGKARFVTFCQQLLAIGCVLAIALAAASVLDLHIVKPVAPEDLRTAVRHSEAYVVHRPVAPRVHNVPVTGIDHQAARRLPPRAGRRLSGGLRLAALSAPERAVGMATVGVTWVKSQTARSGRIEVTLRSRSHGSWSSWQGLQVLDIAPDAGTSEARTTRTGTEPTVVGQVRQVQVRVRTGTGTAPGGMRIAIIDPGAAPMSTAAPAIDTAALGAASTSARTTPGPASATDRRAEASAPGSDGLRLSAMRLAPRPQIYSRAQWGADERLREQSAPSYGTIETGFVHHTVNANDYTAAQVPAIIRGIYAYHVKSLGWRDIGYNFLVDRFGRIWEGRWGGVTRPVIGAHTYGYNEVSFAMSAIGNFQVAKPPQAIIDAFARLFAWKLSMYDIPANATHLWVKNRYLNAINGHRDVYPTECPGQYLYSEIPQIIKEATAIQRAAQSGTPTPTPTPKPTPTPTPPVTPSPLPAPPQPSITFPARQSLTGSTWPDLLVGSRNGTLKVVPTGGMLGFGRTLASAGFGGFQHVVISPDLTGDGRADLVAEKSDGVTRIYPGLGGGKFGRSRDLTSAFAGSSDLVAAGDVNRDGRADLISRDAKTGSLWLYPGRGNGTFGTRILLAKSWGYPLTVAPGDLSSDGRIDLVARRSDGSLWLVPGRGTGLGTPVRLPFTGQGYNALAGLGDVTGDGIPDLEMRRDDGQLLIFPGDGHGGFQHSLGPFGGAVDFHQLTVANVAGGAQSDLVGVSPQGRLVVKPANGKMNLQAPIETKIALTGVTQVIDAGDWNHDGHGDLILRDQAGKRLLIRYGRGDGTFGAPTVMSTAFAGVTHLAAVGDVTGDGHPDLMGWTDAGTSKVLIYPGNGAHGFGRTLIAPARMRTYNQVGAASWQPATKQVFYSRTGSFVPYSGSSSPTARRVLVQDTGALYDWVIGLGDVNGGGPADVVARDQYGYLWLLRGATAGGFTSRQFLGQGFGGYDLGG